MSQIEIIFIRHGEASDAWGDHLDPGLSNNGILQANNLLNHKELQNLKDFSFMSSPKSRAIETGKPLAKKFDKKLNIDEVFIEIPSKDIAQEKKQEWLKNIVQTKIDNLPDFIQSWSDDIYFKTKSLEQNTIIFTHFMVINALLSKLSNKDTLMYFYPDYTSVIKIVIRNNEFEYFLTEDSKKTSINL